MKIDAATEVRRDRPKLQIDSVHVLAQTILCIKLVFGSLQIRTASRGNIQSLPVTIYLQTEDWEFLEDTAKTT